MHLRPTVRRALGGTLAALIGASGLVGAVGAPASAVPTPTCAAAGITVTPLHRPTESPLRPFYSDTGTSSTTHGGYAGYKVSGASTSNPWIELSGFSSAALGLAATQPSAVPLVGTSTDGKPMGYFYLAGPTASASAQSFTATVYNGNPATGGTALCTYADGFSSVTKVIAANANKVTSVVVPTGSVALGQTFDIIATGDTGTRGAGIASDQGPSGEGVFAMAPGMADDWPADKFYMVGVDVSIPSLPFSSSDYLRVYPTGSSNVTYTATYHMVAREPVAASTPVAPVQNIASGTQVKYTGSYSTATLLPPVVNSLNITKTVTDITGASPWRVSYSATVTNSASSAVTIDSFQDNPEIDANWSFVPGSMTVDGSPVTPVVSGGVIYANGPFTVPGSGSLTVTYDLDLTGTLTNTLVALVGQTEVSGAGGSNTVTIDPTVVNVGPTVLPDGHVGTAYSQTITAVGGDGGPYTFTVTDPGLLPPGLSLDPSTGVLSGTPTTPGSYTFEVCATDSSEGSACRTYTVVITNPLQITTELLSDGTVSLPYTDTVNASGGTGTGYTFAVTAGALPGGLTLNADGTITGTPTTAGEFTFTVTVTDSDFNTATKQYTVTIMAGPVTVTTSSLVNGEAGTPYSETLTAVGGDGGPYTWTLGEGDPLPTGLSLNSDGTISGTPTQTGTFNVEFCATDGAAASSCKTLALTVTAAPVVIDRLTVPNGTQFHGYGPEVITASGGDGGPYTFAVNSGALPAGITLNANGTLAGTPTESGTFTFEVCATDGAASTGCQSYTMDVTASPVVIDTASLGDGYVDSAYTDTVTASGGDGGPYTFTVTAGSLPDGLTLNSDGTITGTPTTEGTFTFTVQAEDGMANTTTKEFTITVNPAPVAVTVTTASLADGYPGDAYSQTLAAAGGDGGPYTWALHVDSAALPDGLSLAEDGTISGTPTTPGTYTINVCATDSTPETGCKTLTIVIADAVVITTPSLTGGTVGSVYGQTVEAANGTAPYAFAVTAGALPDGLTMAADGTISGTPTVAGSFTFTVTVTDDLGHTAIKEYTVVIAAAPQPEPGPAPAPSEPTTPTEPTKPADPATPTPPAAPIVDNTWAVTPAGKPVDVKPLDNIQLPPGESFDYSTMKIVDPKTGALTDRVVTPQGTWTLNPTTGVVTFKPAPGFSGRAVVEFRVVTSSGRSLSSDIEATVTKAKLKKVKATVYFGVNSAVLTPAGKKALNKAIAKARGGRQVMGADIVAFVQPTAYAGNDKSLSTARAQSVKAYLKSKGIKQVNSSKGLGKASESGWKARRATVTITYVPRG